MQRRGVGAEGQHQDVAHQPHVLVNVLRDAGGRPRHVRPGERGPPALKSPRLPGLVDPLLHLAHRRQVLVKPALVGLADAVTQTAGVFPHGVQHAAVGPAHLIAEQAVEGEGRIQLQRRRRGR